jgi:hypothetical protein
MAVLSSFLLRLHDAQPDVVTLSINVKVGLVVLQKLCKRPNKVMAEMGYHSSVPVPLVQSLIKTVRRRRDMISNTNSMSHVNKAYGGYLLRAWVGFEDLVVAQLQRNGWSNCL